MSFDPYENNGGTALAIAGDAFCVIASDTRQSSGYLINTRESSKIFPITSKVFLTNCGFSADGRCVAEKLREENKRYLFDNEREMSCDSVAQFTMAFLYSRRFFPLYAFNLVCGLDKDGKGAIYSFDPVGSFEREKYRVVGSGSKLIQPFLDGMVGHKNRNDIKKEITKEEAVSLCKDALGSATERDIYTGDWAEIYVLTAEGVSIERYPLRID